MPPQRCCRRVGASTYDAIGEGVCREWVLTRPLRQPPGGAGYVDGAGDREDAGGGAGDGADKKTMAELFNQLK